MASCPRASSSVRHTEERTRSRNTPTVSAPCLHACDGSLMTVRGGGVPRHAMASNAGIQNGSAASELAADAYPCIMVWVFGPPHTRMWHDASCTYPQLPSNAVIPDTLKCAVVLEAVQGQAPAGWRYAPSLTASARAGVSVPRSGRGKACGAVELEKYALEKNVHERDGACTNESGCPVRTKN
jgi:hypothetical protein